MHRYIALIFTTISLAFSAALPATAQPVTVFAAASLRDALTELSPVYPESVTFSFAGSGTLARQITAGAPADAVVLAHPDWAKWLSDKGMIDPDDLHDVAGGQLVLIGAKDAAPMAHLDAQTLTFALQKGRLALGQRDGVPAGTYAREWLRAINAWDAIQPYLAETDNVRAALALVATGAAPLGIVYASDAVAEDRVKVLYAIPDTTHSPIRYPAAGLTQAGRDFVRFLTTPQAAAIFAKHGFSQ